MIFETITRLRDKLIGNAADTVLQARIFHAISTIALIGLALALLVNIWIKVPLVNTTLIVAWVAIAALFINSRHYGRSQISIIFFNIGSSIILIFNYFINSGIQGPTLLLYLLLLVFTLSVMPIRQFLYWIVINVSIIVALLLSEYYRIGSVQVTYAKRGDLFLDTITTYICIVACIGVVLSYLIHSYKREKNNAIKASKALEAANDSKTRLFSILSHDLRSPFNSIASYLETLHEYELSAEERRFLERTLLDETKNMQVMLHNLLSWTKSQMEGGTSVNLTRLNLSKIVKDCLLVQQAAADLKLVTIQVQINSLVELYADRDMLKIVINNLINNAIKFTPSGGKIQIYSSHDSDKVKFHIADDGIGIPKERQDSLFTFHATSTYGTNYEKGVGLGLILCKEYTEMQNGQISFRSLPNKGTEFIVEFAEFVNEHAAVNEKYC